MRPAPTPWQIFKAFLWMGSTGFGGSLRAQMHAVLVQHQAWLSEEEFLEGTTLVTLMPGPVMSNLASYYGTRLCGGRGAAAALLGLCSPGVALVLAMAGAYFGARGLNHPAINGALHGVAAAAVGLTAQMVWRNLQAGSRTHAGWALMLAAFVAVGLLRLNLLAVLMVLFPVALWLNRPGGQRA